MNILYLEDNPNDALLTQHALSKVTPSIQVDIVHTVRDAVRRLDDPPVTYDLVLSDLNLPDGSGFNLLHHIRSKNYPYAVVIVTGQSDEDIAIAALKAGADDYIAKREDYLKQLPSTLLSALERHNAEIDLHSRALRVLYAEGNTSDSEKTSDHLSKHAPHIRLDFVSTANDLEKILQGESFQEDYDLVVFDYLLPDFNALDAIKDLYEHRRLDIPVILITDRGSEEVVSQAAKLGASEYVVKNPGYLFKLPAVIENAYHRAELLREQAALRIAEEQYRVLIEQSPAATYTDALDDESSSLFISNRIEEFCGYPTSSWLENKDFWLSILHPDDYERVYQEHIRTNASLDSFRMEYRLIARDGNIVWVRDEAIIMMDDDGKPHHWQGILINITDQKRAEEALRRRDAIMEAINLAAEKFLVHSWRDNIQSVLEQLGNAADASRSYIFQNRITTDGNIVSDLIYEWSAPEIQPQINNPEMTGFDFVEAGFDRWITAFMEGHPIYGIVSQLSDAEQAVFLSQGIKSIMCMPIFVSQKWWGFIGFDDCNKERDWSPAEIDALKTSANILGAAIQRLNSEYALQRQLNELTVLQAVTAAGMKSVEVDELLTLTTQTLSNLLFPDNCGVFLYDNSSNCLFRHASYRGITSNSTTNPIPAGKGVVGKTFQSSVPLLIRDVHQFPEYIEINPEINSEMAVPIRIGEQTVGVLNVESRFLAHYTEDDFRLLITIAGQLSTAMEKIHLLEVEHRRLQESETLRQAASVISTSLDLEIVLNTILSSVRKVVPYDSACIFLSNNDSSALSIVAAQGFSNDADIMEMIFPEPGLLIKEVLETRQAVIVGDVQVDPRFESWGPEPEKIRGWMGVPLISRDQVIGYLTLDSLKPNTYSTGNAVLTQTFAYQAAAAINNASLFEETRKRLRELEVINKISSTLRSSVTEDEMLPSLLKETLEAIGTDAGSIWLCDNNLDHVKMAAASGWFTDLPDQLVSMKSEFTSLSDLLEKPFSIDDFSIAEFFPATDRKGIPQGWSGSGLPIRTSTETIGILLVSIKKPREFTSSEDNLLATIAAMAGNAIHRAQLYSRSEQQVERLTALRDVDIAISSSFDLRTTLDVIIAHVVAQLRVDAARILLFNPHMQTLDLSVSRGFRVTKKEDLHQRLSQSPAGTTALENRMLAISNLAENKTIPNSFFEQGFRSYFSVPLNAKEQIKGVLEVFLRQPFSPSPDWLEFLYSLGGQTAIAIDNSQLFTNLQRSNVELELAYDTTLEGWGKALEIRDQETEGHTQRVSEMTLKLARKLGFDGEDLVHIRRGALLHDIGKMGIPDEILRKPGTLTEQEWIIMRKHVDFAYTLLSPIEFLQKALEIPYCHHERWNGNGYPRGLKREEIPLAARIFAIIDVWDALLSDRPYRGAWVREKVIDYIIEQSGIQFDPKIVEIFMSMVESGEIN